MDRDQGARYISIYDPINYSKETSFRFMNVPNIAVACVCHHIPKDTLPGGFSLQIFSIDWYL